MRVVGTVVSIVVRVAVREKVLRRCGSVRDGEESQQGKEDLQGEAHGLSGHYDALCDRDTHNANEISFVWFGWRIIA